MPGTCSFNEFWLCKPPFKEWLRRVQGQSYKASCIACNSKTFDISNVGEAALTSHMESKKHRLANEIRKKSTSISAWAAPKKAQEVCATSASSSVNEAGTSNTRQSTSSVKIRSDDPIPSVRSSRGALDSFVTKSDTLSVEITWCLHLVITHSSHRSNEKTDELFEKIFPDSVIAKEFACGKTNAHVWLDLAFPFISSPSLNVTLTKPRHLQCCLMRA